MTRSAVAVALIAALLEASISRGSQAADAELARQAYRILETHCASCHHISLKVKGFDVLDREALVKSRPNTATYIVPGNLQGSELWARLGVEGDMPPEDIKARPTPGEIETIKKWIMEGAEFPVWDPRPPVSEQDTLAAIRKHLEEDVPPASRPDQRYFSLANIHNNPEFSDADVRLHRAAFAKAINSLHRGRKIIHPTAINKQQTVYVLDLRDVGWTQAWASIVHDYPYGIRWNNAAVQPLQERINELSGPLRDGIPYVRMDWFVANAARPENYHRLLGIPATARELEESLGISADDDFLNDRLVRAGFSASGVSKQNRLIDRHEGAGSYYYRSYDFLKNSGRGVLFRFPLGPAFAGNPFNAQAFEHAGGEIIFRLPNGMQGYMLVDDKGQRIDKGPVEVVNDPNEFSGTPVIVNGLSCIGCHKRGILDYKNTVSLALALAGNGTGKAKVAALYANNQRLETVLQDDRKDYLEALEKVIGPYLRQGLDQARPLTDFVEPIGRVTLWYDNDVTLGEAALELGLSDASELRGAIGGNGELKLLGLGVLADGGTIPRRTWDTLEEARTSLFHRTTGAIGLGPGINPR
jgi:serine/threonine-protein kinase